tara:strand:+ start:1067 stop:1900 length:834 start_codon:yes stop_codon:yes gene_type:complete
VSQIFFPKNSLFLKCDQRVGRWAIPYNFECLNARVENLLWNQRHAIQGQTILDIGSHIGTFAFAALKMGAKFVYSIDLEEHLLIQAEELFEIHGVDKSRYRFEVADAADFMTSLGENKYDTVFCFGLLYYCPDPFRTLQLMSKVVKKNILMDTFTATYAAVQGSDSEFIRNNLGEGSLDLPIMLTVPTQSQKKDYRLTSSFSKKGKPLSLTNYPSLRLIETWLESLEMNWSPIDWTPYARNFKTWQDLITHEQKMASHWTDVYTSGIRTSFRIYPKP